MTPDQFLNNYADLFEAELVAPDVGTCSSTAAERRTIDFFLVHRALANRVRSCHVLEHAETRPHKPVRIEIAQRGHEPLLLIPRAPGRHPPQRPVGPPASPPPSWTPLQGCTISSQDQADSAYGQWAGLADQELNAIMHIPAADWHKYSGRGSDIRFVHVQPPRPGGMGRPRTSPEARAWFWLHDTLLELLAVRTSGKPGALATARGLHRRLATWRPSALPPEEQQAWKQALKRPSRLQLSTICLWAAMAKCNADQQVAKFAYEKKIACQRWARNATAAGASVAHRFIKGPAGWLEDPIDPNDMAPADIQQRSDILKGFWKGIWDSAATQLQPQDWRGYEAECLPRPTLQQVRKAALSFPRATGRGAEQLHPRHFALLSDDALDAWLDIMIQMEAQGILPRQLALLVLVFLPKGDGGHRPIGLFMAAQRLWGRLRRKEVIEWEAKCSRAYFGGCAGASTEQVVWEQLLAKEYATAAGKCSAAVMIDLRKAFEYVRHSILVGRCRAVNFPMHIVRWCMLCYAAPRTLALDGNYTQPFQAEAGIVAGCTHATALLRAYTTLSLDKLVYDFPDLRLKVVVDDMTLQMVDELEERLAPHLALGTAALLDMLSQDLRAVVNTDKTLILASSPRLLDKLHGLIKYQGWDLRKAKSAKNLGIDFACDRAAASVIKGRHTAQALRKGRYCFLRQHGGNTAALAAAGARPAITYGVGAVGCSDTQLRQTRTLLASLAFGDHGGSSLTLKYMLTTSPIKDPYYLLVARPIYMWTVAVWEAKLSIREMQVAFDAACAAPPDKLHGVGPAHATVQALRRIGWRPTTAARWTTHDGIELNLKEVCPKTVALLVHRDSLKALCAHVAAAHGWPHLDQGILIDPIVKLLRTSDRTLNTIQKAKLRNLSCQLIWSQSRRHIEGYASHGQCPACLGAPGTFRHWAWRCPHTWLLRQQQGHSEQLTAAPASDEEHALWSYALGPIPAQAIPRPTSAMQVHWHAGTTDINLEGDIYTDGSMLDVGPKHSFRHDLARAGAGISKVATPGRWVALAWGPLQHLIQDINPV